MFYKLNERFILRKIDNALFDYTDARLFQFNEAGFALLLHIIECEFTPSNEYEKNFLEKLLKNNVLFN